MSDAIVLTSCQPVTIGNDIYFLLENIGINLLMSSDNNTTLTKQELKTIEKKSFYFRESKCEQKSKQENRERDTSEKYTKL